MRLHIRNKINAHLEKEVPDILAENFTICMKTCIYFMIAELPAFFIATFYFLSKTKCIADSHTYKLMAIGTVVIGILVNQTAAKA